jgi:hypothetical protein
MLLAFTSFFQACEKKVDLSNAVAYSEELNAFAGIWKVTYYTDGPSVDTLSVVPMGDFIQVKHNGLIVFPKASGNKMSYTIEGDNRTYFEGKLMSGRLWGTLKYQKGKWSNQRIQWEGEKL